MGMWDKDKEMGRRLDAVFGIGDYLIVFGVEPNGEVPTDIGVARRTKVDVAPVDNPSDRSEVSTLSSAIAQKAELATAEDFPIVAQLLKVPSKKGNPALVLQYVRDYDENSARSGASDEDIPF